MTGNTEVNKMHKSNVPILFNNAVPTAKISLLLSMLLRLDKSVAAAYRYSIILYFCKFSGYKIVISTVHAVWRMVGPLGNNISATLTRHQRISDVTGASGTLRSGTQTVTSRLLQLLAQR